MRNPGIVIWPGPCLSVLASRGDPREQIMSQESLIEDPVVERLCDDVTYITLENMSLPRQAGKTSRI